MPLPAGLILRLGSREALEAALRKALAGRKGAFDARKALREALERWKAGGGLSGHWGRALEAMPEKLRHQVEGDAWRQALGEYRRFPASLAEGARESVKNPLALAMLGFSGYSIGKSLTPPRGLRGDEREFAQSEYGPEANQNLDELAGQVERYRSGGPATRIGAFLGADLLSLPLYSRARLLPATVGALVGATTGATIGSLVDAKRGKLIPGRDQAQEANRQLELARSFVRNEHLRRQPWDELR